MIKKLIILSLTFLLISCGEEETATEITTEPVVEEKTPVVAEETETTENTETEVLSEETQPPLKEEVAVTKVPETEEQPQSKTESTLPPLEEGGAYVINKSKNSVILHVEDRQIPLWENQCAYISSRYPNFKLGRDRTTSLYKFEFPEYTLVSDHSKINAKEKLKGVKSYEECSDQNVRRIGYVEQ